MTDTPKKVAAGALLLAAGFTAGLTTVMVIPRADDSAHETGAVLYSTDQEAQAVRPPLPAEPPPPTLEPQKAITSTPQAVKPDTVITKDRKGFRENPLSDNTTEDRRYADLVPRVDRSREAQQVRKALLNRFWERGIIHSQIYHSGDIPKLVVTDVFSALDYENKESLASLFYAYCATEYDDFGDRFGDRISVIHRRTHEELASFGSDGFQLR